MTKAKVYLWLHAAICIALAAYLSLSAISLYREGSARKAEHPMESIYTPEGAAEKLAKAAPLFLVGVGLLIAGLESGVREDSGKPVKDAALNRDLLEAKIARPSDAMRAERRTQKKLQGIGWGLFALCMVPVLVYILNPVHFPKEDLEGMFLGLMRAALPWTTAGLGALAVTSALHEKSVLREVQAAQDRLREEKEAGIEAMPVPVSSKKNRGILQAAVMTAAIVFIIAGICNQSARDVLYKAVTICTECVGLG